MTQPQRGPGTAMQGTLPQTPPTGPAFDAVPSLEANYERDAAEREPMVLNSAAATKPRIPALTPDEVQQSLEFWEYQKLNPLTPRARQEADTVIQLLRDRQTTSPGGRAALSPADSAMMTEMIDGPFQG